MTWLSFITAALATYYIALSVSRQEGPWRIFERLRNVWTGDDWKGRGIRCLVCVSLYSALVVVVGLVLLGHVAAWDGPIVWLGLAGASVVIDKYWQR